MGIDHFVLLNRQKSARFIFEVRTRLIPFGSLDLATDIVWRNLFLRLTN
jgi:hypothetical protein